MLASLRLALLAAPVLALPALANTWTVDDDGPAQFTTVDAAQAAAQPGDVILVAPGFYPAFHLAKELTVLGPSTGAQPQFVGTSTVAGVQRFTLGGLALQSLQVSGVAGRGVIDECALTSQNEAEVLLITDCAQLVVSRSTLTAFTPGGYDSAGSAAVRATGSTLEWVGNHVIAGSGLGGLGYDGQHALWLDSCQAWITGSAALGGAGGSGGLCGSCGGNGGDGLRAIASSVRVRGASDDGLFGGSPALGGTVGAGIRALSGSTIVSSGVPAPVAVVDGSSAHVQPAQPSPAMTIEGADGPGEVRRLVLRGPQGAPAIVGMSGGSAAFALGGFEGLVWLDPAQLVTTFGFTLQGQEQPVTKGFTVPPLAGIEGLTVWFQGVFPTVSGELVPGSIALGNTGAIVLRF
jgi:hypothetical protein